MLELSAYGELRDFLSLPATPIDDDLICIRLTVDNAKAGWFLGIPHKPNSLECHAEILPAYRGLPAIVAGSALVKALCQQFDFLSSFTKDRHVAFYLRRIGFRYAGKCENCQHYFAYA